MSKLPSFAEAATDMVKFISMIGTQHPEYHEEANRLIADFILSTVVAAARGGEKPKCAACDGRGTVRLTLTEHMTCPDCGGRP